MSEKTHPKASPLNARMKKKSFLRNERETAQPLSVKAREIFKDWLFPKYEKQIGIKEISVIGEQLNSLITHISLATDTSDTFRLELAPRPIRDVTPKHTGTKNAQLCDQLSIFAIPHKCEE